MSLSIREKADTVGTFRFLSVWLMETLARWIATTPELEVKVAFGRHVWEFAQHADALGKRTAELRAPLHYTLAPPPAYRAGLDALAARTATAERIAGIYDGVLPALEDRYRAYLAATDPLLDEPTVRVIERILADFPRLRADREALRAARPDVAAADAAWLADVRRQAAAEPFVAFRAAAAEAT